MSVPLVSVAPHLWIDVSVGGSVPSGAAGSGVRVGWHGRNVAPVRVACVLVLAGGVEYPWDSAVDSATDGALSSNRHGVVVGGT